MPANETDIVKVIIGGTAVILFLGGCVVFFVIMYKRRQETHKKEKKKMESSFREELLHAQLEIREQTLKNISQEIHDNIGQTLSLVKLNLNTIDLEKPTAMDKVSNSKELVGKAIHDLRNLSRSLNTDNILSAGLLKGIESELGFIEKAGVFKTLFAISGQPPKLDAKKELIVFRIVQESLNNIIKHSKATSIGVEAWLANQHLCIKVNDDGKGFDTGTAISEGSGLRNMTSRAELIGANFEIESNSCGTTITITLPISDI